MAALNRYYLDDVSSRIGIKCVFISHQRKDKTVARAIADYIKNLVLMSILMNTTQV